MSSSFFFFETPEPYEQPDEISMGALIGIVVGVPVGVAAIVAAVAIYLKLSRKRSERSERVFRFEERAVGEGEERGGEVAFPGAHDPYNWSASPPLRSSDGVRAPYGIIVASPPPFDPLNRPSPTTPAVPPAALAMTSQPPHRWLTFHVQPQYTGVVMEQQQRPHNMAAASDLYGSAMYYKQPPPQPPVAPGFGGYEGENAMTPDDADNSTSKEP